MSEEDCLKLFKKCKKGDVEKVESLIKLKVDPNYCGDEGTPLTWAVKTSHFAMVMCLLQSPRIKVNQRDTGGYSPLLLASMYDYKQPDLSIIHNNHIIRKLLINTPGIDINIQDMAGNTPLMYCALTDNKDIVNELLQAGADINLINSMGMTALHNAASINSAEVVALLVSRGAKYLKDNSGNLPSELTHDLQVLKLLNGKKTSVSHPFTLDFIDRTLCPMLKDARLGMSMCPGREWAGWSRDFNTDLKIIVENYKVDVVASIITHTELKQMNYPDFYDKIRKFGLESIEYSVHDKWLPNSVENFLKVAYRIVDLLREEKTVLVHCNGGRGRTGLIVAACIIIIGYSSEQAIQMVRSARTGMLRNPAQEVFLHAIQSKLQSEDFSQSKLQAEDFNLTIPDILSCNSSPGLITTKKSSFFDILPVFHKTPSSPETSPPILRSINSYPNKEKISKNSKKSLFIARSEQNSPRLAKTKSVTLNDGLTSQSLPAARKSACKIPIKLISLPNNPISLSTPTSNNTSPTSNITTSPNSTYTSPNSTPNTNHNPPPALNNSGGFRAVDVPTVFSIMERAGPMGEIPLEFFKSIETDG